MQITFEQLLDLIRNAEVLMDAFTNIRTNGLYMTPEDVATLDADNAAKAAYEAYYLIVEGSNKDKMVEATGTMVKPAYRQFIRGI